MNEELLLNKEIPVLRCHLLYCHVINERSSLDVFMNSVLTEAVFTWGIFSETFIMSLFDPITAQIIRQGCRHPHVSETVGGVFYQSSRHTLLLCGF